MAKDYDSDIDRAEDRKLVSLLEQAAFALEEGPEVNNQHFFWLKEIDPVLGCHVQETADGVGVAC